MIEELRKKALRSLEIALEEGAESARATLVGGMSKDVATLDGKIDRISANFDTSLEICIFTDSRFGSFSTNKTSEDDLRRFIRNAVASVRSIDRDPCYALPAPERTCRTAKSGDELGLFDPAVEALDASELRKMALALSVFGSDESIISEESEISCSTEHQVIVDTNGLECVSSESCIDYGVEVTIRDAEGRRYCSYDWESRTSLDKFDGSSVGRKALDKALAQIGQKPAPTGRYDMVVSRDAASKMITPILDSLNGYDIQQGSSFLRDSLGKKVFGDGMTITDTPHIKGESGSRLFDSEGVGTKEDVIIENGVVKKFFINTYISNKTGLEPTIEDPARPHLQKYSDASDARQLISRVRKGIYVTEFNGGNYDPSTGDFSYGVVGFLIRDGKLERPVSEMLVTGNYLDLWNKFTGAGEDVNRMSRKLYPSVAFRDVDFSG